MIKTSKYLLFSLKMVRNWQKIVSNGPIMVEWAFSLKNHPRSWQISLKVVEITQNEHIFGQKPQLF